MTTKIQGLQKNRLLMLAFSATLTMQVVHMPIAYAESPVAQTAKAQKKTQVRLWQPEFCERRTMQAPLP